MRENSVDCSWHWWWCVAACCWCCFGLDSYRLL